MEMGARTDVCVQLTGLAPNDRILTDCCCTIFPTTIRSPLRVVAGSGHDNGMQLIKLRFFDPTRQRYVTFAMRLDRVKPTGKHTLDDIRRQAGI